MLPECNDTKLRYFFTTPSSVVGLTTQLVGQHKSDGVLIGLTIELVSDCVLADTSGRSPRKIFVFIIISKKLDQNSEKKTPYLILKNNY